jgi:hypothetical protein
VREITTEQSRAEQATAAQTGKTDIKQERREMKREIKT